MCSLAPEADDLAAIKKISTAGGIPYVDADTDAKQTKLFVVAIEVEQKRKKRKKTKKQ